MSGSHKSLELAQLSFEVKSLASHLLGNDIGLPWNWLRLFSPLGYALIPSHLI